MKKKVISAIIALAIVIPAIILGSYYFTIGVGVIALLGYKEFVFLKDTEKQIPNLVKYLGAILLIFVILNNYQNKDYALYLDYKVLATCVLGLFLPVIIYNDANKYNVKTALYLLGSVLFLGIPFSILIYFRINAVKYLILLLLIPILTDTFAQIFGGLIGKNKLLPEISPNKTWEGAIMGSLIATFICSAYYITLINTNLSLVKVALCILLLTLIGQLGDLFFSAVKRYNGIKDFSNIMPGHGGILDRLDSIIFVSLGFMLLINIL